MVAHDTGGAVASGLVIFTDLAQTLLLSDATSDDFWPANLILEFGAACRARG